jgi:hypothetical protein
MQVGEFVESDDYAAALRAAADEEGQSLPRARAAYERLLRDHDDDPLLLTRLAAMACAIDPDGSETAKRFTRARRVAAEYAPFWEERARCDLLRGDKSTAAESLRRAASLAPVERWAARAAVCDSAPEVCGPNDPGLLAMTRAREAWALALRVELAQCADRAHCDDEVLRRAAFWGQGLLSRWVPHVRTSRDDRDLRAVAAVIDAELAAQPNPPSAPSAPNATTATGATQAVRTARQLAGGLVDRATGPLPELITLLAVDDAIERGDLSALSVRAMRGHVAPAVVAARALLVRRVDVFRELAADFTGGTRAREEVLLSLLEGNPQAPPTDGGVEPLSASVWAACAEALEARGAGLGKAWAARVAHTPPLPLDPAIKM